MNPLLSAGARECARSCSVEGPTDICGGAEDGAAPALTVDAAFALAAEPTAVVVARIAAAASEVELDGLRLAVCAHPECGALAARLAGRRRDLAWAQARAALAVAR